MGHAQAPEALQAATAELAQAGEEKFQQRKNMEGTRQSSTLARQSRRESSCSSLSASCSMDLSTKSLSRGDRPRAMNCCRDGRAKPLEAARPNLRLSRKTAGAAAGSAPKRKTNH
eukprot:554303-Pyramimonas_sp.AAC.1